MYLRFFISLVIFISPFSIADSEGDIEYSDSQYPGLMKLLNASNREDCYAYVNDYGEGKAITAIGKDQYVVNYATSCEDTRDEFAIVIVEEYDGDYSYSELQIPYMAYIDTNEGEFEVALPYGHSTGNTIEVTYRLNCKSPASVTMIGSCTNDEVYELQLSYQVINDELSLLDIIVAPSN